MSELWSSRPPLFFYLLLAVVVPMAAACAHSPSPERSSPSWVFAANATVVEVIDGDTVRLNLASGTEIVRLLGVDTPETVDPNRPAQCFGAEASAYLSAMLPAGRAVRVTRDQQARDAFGRLLAYVFVAHDGTFTNLQLVRNGYADTLSIEPNTTYRRDFAAALRDARQRRVGLWANCDGPDQPVDPPVDPRTE